MRSNVEAGSQKTLDMRNNEEGDSQKTVDLRNTEEGDSQKTLDMRNNEEGGLAEDAQLEGQLEHVTLSGSRMGGPSVGPIG